MQLLLIADVHILSTNKFVDMNSSHTAQNTLWLGCDRS